MLGILSSGVDVWVMKRVEWLAISQGGLQGELLWDVNTIMDGEYFNPQTCILEKLITAVINYK